MTNDARLELLKKFSKKMNCGFDLSLDAINDYLWHVSNGDTRAEAYEKAKNMIRISMAEQIIFSILD